jgi:hypothetical protein
MGKTCAWCHKPTELPKIFAADVPILDWMEEKIDVFCNKNGINRNILWNNGIDWEELDLDEKTEAELLVYDKLIETVSRKTICKECLIEDDKLWRKYYHSEDFNDEFELDIDSL